MHIKSTGFGAWWAIAVAAIVVLVPTQIAHAYLDPGTGSFLLQIILAGLLGMMFTLRLFRDKIMSMVRTVLGRKPSTDESAQTDNVPSSQD